MIPAPRTDTPLAASGDFLLSACATITVSDRRLLAIAHDAARVVAKFLPALSVELTSDAGAGDIRLQLLPEDRKAATGPESYNLRASDAGVQITSHSVAGIFYGVQTLKQLVAQASNDSIPARIISDRPRFEHRGLMLDVVRHFHPVKTVKRVIEQMAALKLNVLHMHLTDDQGWRIAIQARPNLVKLSSRNEVGGGPGGHYERSDWDEIVAHAAEHFVTVVPEIDLPGHTNAALVAYPELAPAGVIPRSYTGTRVGFSTIDTENVESLEFVRDVLTELCEMTPGPYIHIGGDESFVTASADYQRFMARVIAIVTGLGKIPIGWHELGQCSEIPHGTIGQYWGFSGAESEAEQQLRNFVEQGSKVILSPSDRAYFDIKQAPYSSLGTLWHGKQQPTTLFRAYDWDPAALVQGIGEESILGVEAALWTEQASTPEEINTLLYPRLAATAEIAWSAPQGADRPLLTWESFAARVAALGTI